MQLHITNWYPNRYQPHEAPFIREYFKAIPDDVEREIWHVQVRHEESRFRLLKGSYGEREHFFILEAPIKTWRIIEWLHFVLLAWLRLKLGRRSWDVVNVHVAYPLLRFPRAFRALFGRAVVITEHWSAYRKSFNLPPDSPGRRRIQRIFHHGLPVIAVSRALMRDIVEFAETDGFPQHVIPNVVDPEIFHPGGEESQNERPTFLMIGNWAPIKRPLLVMEAFIGLLETLPQAQLRVVGYGAQMADMEAFVRDHGLEESVTFLGPLEKSAIAGELRGAWALLHASEYETFSVVCAEALCCGTPVVASHVGGIQEFVDETNGILVENEVGSWIDSLNDYLSRRQEFDREQIAASAIKRFNPSAVGSQVQAVLESVARAD